MHPSPLSGVLLISLFFPLLTVFASNGSRSFVSASSLSRSWPCLDIDFAATRHLSSVCGVASGALLFLPLSTFLSVTLFLILLLAFLTRHLLLLIAFLSLGSGLLLLVVFLNGWARLLFLVNAFHASLV